MQKLYIEQTFQTPLVLLDPKNNAFEIRGNSLPNNPYWFYVPVLKWLDEYAEQSNPESVFVFQLNHQNSSSKKVFQEMLKSLDRIHQSGKKVSLDWHYPEDDEDIFQYGLEFKKSVSFPVNCVPIPLSN